MSNGGNIPEYKVPKEYPYGGLPKNEPYANPARNDCWEWES